MLKTTTVFRATGSDFSPANAERVSGVSFSKKNEPGSTGTTGRYRGQPLPYGSGELVDSENEIDLQNPNVMFFAVIERIAPACLAAGATLMLLHIDVAYTDQCNIEFSHEFVAALAQLGISITMSCFEDD